MKSIGEHVDAEWAKLSWRKRPVWLRRALRRWLCIWCGARHKRDVTNLQDPDYDLPVCDDCEILFIK